MSVRLGGKDADFDYGSPTAFEDDDEDLRVALSKAAIKAKRFMYRFVIANVFLLAPLDLILGAFFLASVPPTSRTDSSGVQGLLPTTATGWLLLFVSILLSVLTTGVVTIMWWKVRTNTTVELVRSPMFWASFVASIADTYMDVGVITVLNFGPETANHFGLPPQVTVSWLCWSLIIAILSFAGEPLIGWLASWTTQGKQAVRGRR